MASSDRFLLAAVMGWPISQSRSPMLHNFWFAQHGLTGSYVPLAIPPERLEAALRSLPVVSGYLSSVDVQVHAQQDEPPQQDREQRAGQHAQPGEAEVTVVPGDETADDEIDEYDEAAKPSS